MTPATTPVLQAPARRQACPPPARPRLPTSAIGHAGAWPSAKAHEGQGGRVLTLYSADTPLSVSRSELQGNWPVTLYKFTEKLGDNETELYKLEQGLHLAHIQSDRLKNTLLGVVFGRRATARRDSAEASAAPAKFLLTTKASTLTFKPAEPPDSTLCLAPYFLSKFPGRGLKKDRPYEVSLVP